MDLEIVALEAKELARQNSGIELIASENYPSRSVRAANGSIFTAKYAEGYPDRRYYGGPLTANMLYASLYSLTIQ